MYISIKGFVELVNIDIDNISKCVCKIYTNPLELSTRLYKAIGVSIQPADKSATPSNQYLQIFRSLRHSTTNYQLIVFVVN